MDSVAEPRQPLQRAPHIALVLAGQTVHEVERRPNPMAQQGLDAAQNAVLAERTVDQGEHARIGALDADFGLGHAGLGEAGRLGVGERVRADFDEERERMVAVFAGEGVKDGGEARVRVERGVRESDFPGAALAEDSHALADFVRGEAGERGAAHVVAAEGAAQRTAAARLQIRHPGGVGPIRGIVGCRQQLDEGAEGARPRALPHGPVRKPPRDAAEIGRLAGADVAEHGREDGLPFPDDEHVPEGAAPGLRIGENGVVACDVGPPENGAQTGEPALEPPQQRQGALDVPEIARRGDGIGRSVDDALEKPRVGG